MGSPRKLATVQRKLLAQHGAETGSFPDDPFQLVLWEQVGYLADDEKRRGAFQALERRVGLSPEAILRAPLELLTEIAAMGGSIAPDTRAARMQESAKLVVAKWGGDLKRVLALDPAQAVRELAKFPMIGKPGAEKILLFTRTHPVLALDSNGLRVLLRLGYGKEDARYEKTYESVRSATAPEEPRGRERLLELHRLLRLHGREICKRSRPDCPRCSLIPECAYYREHFAGGAGERRR
jgi:endonuclease III